MFLGMMAATAVVSVLSWMRVDSNLAWSLAPLPCGVVTFAWLCLAIRCKRCGGKPGLVVIQTASVNEWFTKVISLASCPRCGDSGALDHV